MECVTINRRGETSRRHARFPVFCTHERLSRLLIGVVTLTGLAVGYWITPWGFLILVGLSVNLIQFAFTGRCQVKKLLDRLGVPYERDQKWCNDETNRDQAESTAYSAAAEFRPGPVSY